MVIGGGLIIVGGFKWFLMVMNMITVHVCVCVCTSSDCESNSSFVQSSCVFSFSGVLILVSSSVIFTPILSSPSPSVSNGCLI